MRKQQENGEERSEELVSKVTTLEIRCINTLLRYYNANIKTISSFFMSDRCFSINFLQFNFDNLFLL